MARARTSPGYPGFLPDLPLALWVGPHAAATLLPRLRGLLDLGVRSIVIPGDRAHERPRGPAVLLLSVSDIQGPSRDVLLEAAAAALPGRPVLHGGSSNRDVLLDAINTWRAYRLVPRNAQPAVIVDAIRKAHEACALEVGMQLGVESLRGECERLDAALVELRTAQEKLLHSERLAMIGRVCRTLQSRLGAFFEDIDALKRACQTTGEEESLDSLLGATIDASLATKALLDDMVALTEGGEGRLELAVEDLDAVIERACLALRRHPDIKMRDFRVSCGSNASVRIDRHRLVHALMNLVRNAIQATEPGGVIELRTLAAPPWALIEVADNGSGMSEEVRKRIFQPFFTTKGSEGMGLGLRMTRTVVERQGGTLVCESEPGRGTCFRLSLPMVEGNDQKQEGSR